MKNEHGYAKQYLDNTGFEIYIGDKKILQYSGNPQWDLPEEYMTKIELGQPIGDDTEEVKIVTSYSTLLGLGYVIASRRCEKYERTFRGQKQIYGLAKKEMALSDLGQFPPEHFVQWDVINRAMRLIGKNAGVPRRPGRGPWIVLRPDNGGSRKKDLDLDDYSKKADAILNELREGWAPVERESILKSIPETVFMISDAKELVCIDHNALDPPVIGIVGQAGMGKTVCIHAILDQVINKTVDYEDPMKGHRAVVYNDRQQQLLSWCKPLTSPEWIRSNQTLNHYSTPLQSVYLFPHNSDLKSIDVKYGVDQTLNEEEGVSFRMTLPYEGVIDDYKAHFEGREDYNLGQSAKYFKQLGPHLKRCKLLSHIKRDLNKYLGHAGEDGKIRDKSLKGSINKIYAAMEDLFETQLVDISTDHPSKWSVFYKGEDLGKFFPIPALLTAGLLPIVENGNIYSKDYYAPYMKFLIKGVYERLLNKQMPYNGRTWQIVDELGQIYKKNKKRTVAAETIIDTVTEGRKPNLGTAYTLQDWKQVDDEIKLNTSYVIAFNTNQPSELSGSFRLDKCFKDDLKRLQTFECIAMTTRKFKVYDMDGNHRYTNEPIKGKIIKPTSEHVKPS